MVYFLVTSLAFATIALPQSTSALSYIQTGGGYPYTDIYSEDGYPVYETPYVKVVDETRGGYRYSDDRYYNSAPNRNNQYNYSSQNNDQYYDSDYSRGSLSQSQKASRWPRYYESPSKPLAPYHVTSDRYIQYLNDRQEQYRYYPYEETHPYFPQKYYHQYDDPHFYRKKLLNTEYRERMRNTYDGNNSYDNYDSYFYDDGHQRLNRYGH